MSEWPKLDIVDGKRERQLFANPCVSWRFQIRTGPRCSGLVSQKCYASPQGAYKAGENALRRLGGE